MSSAQFGSYNIETGEVQEGYVENEEMKYRREPWYKRIFHRKLAPKVGFVRIVELTRNDIPIRVSVCKKVCPITGEIFSLYAHYGDDRITFSIPAFEATGELILEKWQ